jgi:hypothetical protein
MREGLLWFDSDPKRKLPEKIDRAAARYQAKFGRQPTICYINIKDLDDMIEEIQGVQLRVVNNVRPHHFLIGVESEPAAVKAI